MWNTSPGDDCVALISKEECFVRIHDLVKRSFVFIMVVPRFSLKENPYQILGTSLCSPHLIRMYSWLNDWLETYGNSHPSDGFVTLITKLEFTVRIQVCVK
jgi:hypothetical protein